jgi:hypothetical protein
VTVVGRVGRVERAIAGPEPHLSGNRGAQVGGERVRVGYRTSNRLASGRFSSRPRPGRDKSG